MVTIDNFTFIYIIMQEGGTPFLIAVAEGHRSIAFFLLDNGNDVFECQNVSIRFILQCID